MCPVGAGNGGGAGGVIAAAARRHWRIKTNKRATTGFRETDPFIRHSPATPRRRPAGDDDARFGGYGMWLLNGSRRAARRPSKQSARRACSSSWKTLPDGHAHCSKSRNNNVMARLILHALFKLRPGQFINDLSR